MAQKRQVLKEVLFDDVKEKKVLKEVLFDDVEEKVEYEFLTRDQFFAKVPQRSMSAHGIEIWERYLQDPKGFKF